MPDWSVFKRLRERAGLTQSELAKLVGVEPATISRYEAGLCSGMPFTRVIEVMSALQATAQDWTDLGVSETLPPATQAVADV